MADRRSSVLSHKTFNACDLIVAYSSVRKGFLFIHIFSEVLRFRFQI